MYHPTVKFVRISGNVRKMCLKYFSHFSSTMDGLPTNPEELTLAQARDYCLRHLPGSISNAIPANIFKPSRRRRGGRPQAVQRIVVLPPRILPVQPNTDTYFFKNWNRLLPEPRPAGISNPIMFDCATLDALNWDNFSENDTVMCFDPDHEFVFARISSRSCAELRGHRGSNFNQLRQLFHLAGRIKPNVGRGRGRGGCHNFFYKCWGWRKSYSLLPISEYVYCPHAAEYLVLYLDLNLKAYIGKLEMVLRRVLSRLVNFHWFMNLANFIKLPSFSCGPRVDGQPGIFTQLSLACGGYWSNLHIDRDFMFTVLSVLASNHTRDTEVLYYFNFPSFGVSIPMRSGDFILFNSNIPHCSSNSASNEDFIYSAYVATKTVEYAMLEMVRELIKARNRS